MKLIITVNADEDQAVRAAAASEGRTISDFLRARIFGSAGTLGGKKIEEIAALQRVSISILARMWSESNPQAAEIIGEMVENTGVKA
ncbi:MAG: hypothetical protein K5982_01525 [Selenomonadaceae bacterium]|nr:hypothetical protein [Selenomonadaceae bacterium]